MEEGHNDVDAVQLGVRRRRNLPNTGGWLCCLPCNWLSANTSVHKASITVAMLVVTSLLVASPVLFLISGAPSMNKVNICQSSDGCGIHDEICKTAECYGASMTIRNILSLREDPCDDFYKFSCGSWAEGKPGHYNLQSQVNSEIQQMLETTAQSGPFEKIGQFYNSCLRNKRDSTVKKLLSLLHELGGYLGTGMSNLTELISRLLLINGAPLFDLRLDKDLRNKSALVVFLDHPKAVSQPMRVLHSQQRTLNNEDSFEEKRLLLLGQLLVSFLPNSLQPEQRAKETQNILLLTTMLSKIYPQTKDYLSKHQVNGTYKEYNIMSLQDYYGFVQWKQLLQNVFSRNITANDVILVVDPNYMDKLSRVLAHFESRIIHNTLLLVYATDMLNELFLQSNDQEKSKFCTRITMKLLNQEVSALYLTRYSKGYIQHLVSRVKILLERLKETLKTRMDSLPWLDSVSRKAALSKISTMNGYVPTWPQLANKTYVTSLLRDVEIAPNDFLENVVHRYIQKRNSLYGQHKGESSHQKWPFPFTTKPFYEVTTNNVVIPLAVLTEPNFRMDMPGYVRYGTLGMVLSHELLHGLDMTEPWNSDSGPKMTWLTKKSTLKLEARLECISKQYTDAFHRQVLLRGAKVPVQFDWNITRNENMADISGFQIAFETWTKYNEDDKALPGLNLTTKQLFFINAAQVYCTRMTPEDYTLQVEKDFHTPVPERVNGVMMNSPAFSEMFSCSIGSKMNPLRKCSAY